MRKSLFAVLVFGAFSPAVVSAAEKPTWVEAMRAAHRGFAGQRGYVAQFGDSITFSMAFWTPIGWDEPDQYLTKDDGLAKRPRERRWRDTLQGLLARDSFIPGGKVVSGVPVVGLELLGLQRARESIDDGPSREYEEARLAARTRT